MSWNDTPAVGGGHGRDANIGGNPENTPPRTLSGDDSGSETFVNGQDNEFAVAPQNISKHQGACFNCGEVGHNKSDCANPRVERPFDGTCNACGQQGHRAAICPSRGPLECHACRQPGHMAAQCTNAYAIHREEEGHYGPEEAWSLLLAADKSRDSSQVRLALEHYSRSMPDLTFVDVEKALRKAGMYFHLIAKEQTVTDTKTVVNLQGKKGCTYVVSFQASIKPTRLKFASGWPQTAEENLERLADAGYVMDSFVPKCGNCDQIGHKRKACTEPRAERENSGIKCSNCGENGHYLRDCKAPRNTGRDKDCCRNCGELGHKAADCTEPRSTENVECRSCGETGHFSRECPSRQPMTCHNCGNEGHKSADCTEERKMTCRKCSEEGHMARDCPNAPAMTCYNCGQEGHGSRNCVNERVIKCLNCEQTGHFSRDCPEPKNPANMTCRNCDERGHLSRECPKPRDWSRVQCRNCNEYGHTQVRCPRDPVEQLTDAMGGANFGEAGGSDNGGGSGMEWTTSNIAVVGGWDTEDGDNAWSTTNNASW